MNNMSYYFVAVDLIMKQNLHKLLRSFLSDLKKNPEKVDNECTIIYSGQYGSDPRDREYLYAVMLQSGQLAILYSDRYSIGEVFLIFNIVSNTKNKLKLESFGSNEYIIYNPNDNKYKDMVFERSAAKYFNEQLPISYEEYVDFFYKVFDNFWISKIIIYKDASNIIFDYMDFYHIL